MRFQEANHLYNFETKSCNFFAANISAGIYSKDTCVSDLKVLFNKEIWKTIVHEIESTRLSQHLFQVACDE